MNISPRQDVIERFNWSKLDSTTEITPLETDIDVSNQTDDSTCINILVWYEYIVFIGGQKVKRKIPVIL